MNRLKKAVLAIGLGILAMSAQAANPIVTNGFFDQGSLAWSSAGSQAATFTTEASLQSTSYGPSYSTHAWIYQTLTLGEGTWYSLAFTSGGNGFGEVRLYDADLILNGSIDPVGFNVPGQHSFSFATGPGTGTITSKLEFYVASGSITIDNVTVTAVPEPESWAMLLVGLTAVGGLARRRKAGQITG